jgi:hypothetical protein
MNYPYNLFKTNNNVSFSNLNDIYSSILYKSSGKISLLIDYKSEIEEFIINNKLDKEKLKKIKILESISNEYFDKIIYMNKTNEKINLNKKIEIFYKELLSFKDIISKNIIYIKKFNNISKNFSNDSIFKYSSKLSFNNPLNIKKLESIALTEKSYFNKITFINSDNNFKKTLDILTQGNNMNLSLPSIGIIHNKFYNTLDNSFPNYVNFISKIAEIKDVNYKTNQEISSLIPFISLDLGSTISNILLSTSNDNSSKYILENMISRITIDMNEIFLKKNNNKINKIKTEYIIPYKFYKDEFIPINNIDLEKYRDVKTLLKLNNDLIINIIKKVFNSSNKSHSIKLLEKNNYINILACYLFYIINITYDILKNYLDKIDNVIKGIALSKKNIFGNIDIKGAFNFISSLKKSFYKFKLILLNNFYYLFLPSNYSEGNYGMKLNEYNCYVPISILQNDTNYIYEKYPFNNYISVLLDETIKVDKKLLTDFILFNNQVSCDIYDSNTILEFGAWAFNYINVKKVCSFLSNYYSILEKSNMFNIFIINIIINNTILNKKIPIEFINITDLLNKIISRNNINIYNNLYDIETKIFDLYDNSIELTTNYWVKINELKKKLKKNNLNKILYLLCFNTYYIKSESIISIIKYKIYDINLKKTLLEKCIERKKYYQELIKKYI